MKFGQLIKYNNRNIFLKNHTQNEAVTVAPDHFLFFKKALYEVKAAYFQYILETLDLAYNKNELHKTFDY